MDKYPLPVSIESTEKILMQMKRSVFCIYSKDGSKATGFFCLIPIKDDNSLPVIITNNHVINERILEKEKEFLISFNNRKEVIKIEKNMAFYTNQDYDITIIEINPMKYNIKSNDFLEIEFKENYKDEYNKESIYLIQYARGEKVCVSYGQIRIDDYISYKLKYYAQNEPGVSGAPILDLKTHKIIGLYTSQNYKYTFNNGTILKFPITEFMNKYKDFLSSRSLQNNNINSKNIDKRKSEKEEKKYIINNNLSLEEELKEEKDKNKKLQEKIEQYESLINELLNKSNNELNANEVIQGFLKKDKEIEILKQKLSRFPFELSEGEELYSLIFTSGDHKIHHSIICKNTSKFSSIQSQLYDEYPDYSETNNLFTVRGNKINRNKSLEDNNIKNNDIIELHVIDH